MSRYDLPVYPALAVLFSCGLSGSAHALTSVFKKINRKKLVQVLSVVAVCGLLVLVFASIIFWSLPTYSSLEYQSKNPFPSKAIAFWINQTVPANATIIGGYYCWVLQYYLNLPDPSSRLIWGNSTSWVTYSVNKSLAEGNPVFIVSVQMDSCKFLTENFQTTFYAKYDESLSLYEISPKSPD
jgi:hypothetical protein